MKTIRVRPVLLPTNYINATLTLYHDGKGKYPKLSSDLNKLQYHTNQQLILISLEDETIKVGDLFLADDRDNVMDDPIYSIQKCKEIKNEWIFGNDLDLGYNPDWSEKVIAQQSQLSPELIQQLVDEYNNGGMKDFEIEMNDNYNDVNRLIDVEFPKLTNGFVTVVEKDACDKCSKDCKKTSTITGEFGSCEEFTKSILYTEEEVLELCVKLESQIKKPYSYYDIAGIEAWFNKNKKK